jgi:hypothetical protein
MCKSTRCAAVAGGRSRALNKVGIFEARASPVGEISDSRLPSHAERVDCSRGAKLVDAWRVLFHELVKGHR